ncbi:MAG: hypothetical protein FWD17_14480 [Polyangiaceae bacterium]|nr:hypothetical protein [Polyangiaceae bacterium]
MADLGERRCGSCARFVRVVERVADTGEVTRTGECLLGVWPSPLYESSTCSQWVRRGEFKARPESPAPRARRAPSRSALSVVRGRRDDAYDDQKRAPIVTTAVKSLGLPALPEDLLQMDAEEFRRVLAEVIRDELGVGDVEIAGKWEGGEMILKPGKEGLQEKRIPLEALFHKVVMIRDKLRVLEQKINAHTKLGDDEKVQLQQYVTACYGSLTTFNALFAQREDQFIGQKGDD